MAYVQNFFSDLAEAKKTEELVRNVFGEMTDEYEFEDVSNERQFFHRGDIRAIHKATGKEVFIEVKDDSRIHNSKNILCEEEVYFKENDYWQKGCMHSNYDIYVVVSRKIHKIYVIDFKKLRQFYKDGEFKKVDHAAQTTYCYLYPLGDAGARGAIISAFHYRDKEVAA